MYKYNKPTKYAANLSELRLLVTSLYGVWLFFYLCVFYCFLHGPARSWFCFSFLLYAFMSILHIFVVLFFHLYAMCNFFSCALGLFMKYNRSFIRRFLFLFFGSSVQMREKLKLMGNAPVTSYFTHKHRHTHTSTAHNKFSELFEPPSQRIHMIKCTFISFARHLQSNKEYWA